LTQASSELWFVGAVVLPNIVLDGPAIVATLCVGAAIDDCQQQDDDNLTSPQQHPRVP